MPHIAFQEIINEPLNAIFKSILSVVKCLYIRMTALRKKKSDILMVLLTLK